MVTGVETAGLVLAAFPLIISALEHYQEGFETLQDWWRFRSEFVAFTHSIGIQSVMFMENLEELLRPIVASDLEMTSLLDDPGGTTWNDPSIERRLMERLPRSYDIYRCAIDDINLVLEKLKAKLGIKDNQMTWTFDQSAQGRLRWAYEFRRIKFTLSRKKREKMLQSLATRNNELQTLMGSSERLAPSRHQRKTSLSQFSQRVRDHASCLYGVLASRWGCDCQSRHGANLQLENRFPAHRTTGSKETHLSDINFNVLFHFGAASTSTQPILWTWQETEVRVLAEITDQLMPQADHLPPKPRSPVPGLQIARASSTPSKTSGSQTPRSVSFASDQQEKASSISDSIDLTEIDGLCVALKEARQGQARLGLLLDEQKRRYGFRPVVKQQPIVDTFEQITLDSLLRRSEKGVGSLLNGKLTTLSRRERLLVAVVLASSLLQLHSTPWLTQRWSKRNIFFLRGGGGSTELNFVERVYISPKTELPSEAVQEAPHHTTPTMTSTANECRKSILALGIMLLELCFGQALEDQHFRSKYLGPDGKPNDFTDFATAMQWQEDVLGEGGPGFDNAIRRCIVCNFSPKTTDLADSEFREAVYSEVVQPLEETLRCFDNVSW